LCSDINDGAGTPSLQWPVEMPPKSAGQGSQWNSRHCRLNGPPEVPPRFVPKERLTAEENSRPKTPPKRPDRRAIRQSLENARGKNRRQHPFLPSMIGSTTVSPAGVLPPGHGPEPRRTSGGTSPEVPASPDGGSWRTKLRERDRRVLEASRPNTPSSPMSSPRTNCSSQQMHVVRRLRTSQPERTRALFEDWPWNSPQTDSAVPQLDDFRPPEADSVPQSPSSRSAGKNGARQTRGSNLAASGSDAAVQPLKEKTWKPSKLKASLKGLAGNFANEVQRIANKRLVKRLHNVDRRYFRKQSQHELELEDAEAHPAKELQIPEQPAVDFTFGRGNLSFADGRHSEVLHLKAALQDLEVEHKEVEIPFQVVRRSSERPESPAVELESSGGWWESAPGHTDNQYVVLQLLNKAPKSIHALEVSLPGNDCGPRLCRWLHSTEGPDGPWKETWSFEITSKQDARIRTTYETGLNNAKDFKIWLRDTFRGGAQEACKTLFEGNESGTVSFVELSAAISRCKQHMFTSSGMPAWCTEVGKLFEELDERQTGHVSLESLEHVPVNPPQAAWWKLHIVNNWGSSKKLQVVGPVRLFTSVEVQLGGVSQMRVAFVNQKAKVIQSDNLIQAFDIETLGVDPVSVHLRRLAKKYNISILDIEDMHKMFTASSEVTQDGATINKGAFQELLLRMHGTEDLSDVPSQRLRFFWQQADMDGSGAIDFEEFIMWYDRYGVEINNRRKPLRASAGLKRAGALIGMKGEENEAADD